MKALALHRKRYYEDIVAYDERNSFGDQTITIIKEHLDGKKETIFEGIYHEGNHVPFVLAEMNKLITKEIGK